VSDKKIYEIKILPKKEVLDSQGRATQKVLEKGGFSLSKCSVGRYIEVESSESIEAIKKMANYVLYNPLIEDIDVQLKSTNG